MFQPQPVYFGDFPYGVSPQHQQSHYIYDSFSAQNTIQGHQQLRLQSNHNRAGPVTFSTTNFVSAPAAPTPLWGIGQSTPQQQQLSQRTVQRHQQLQYDNTPHIRLKMEELDDYEAQQALAGGYSPKLEGPLVGEKKSSHAITEEYAKADPVYVEKTRRLPLTYTYYRPVRGDGNCGWRAIGFSYFESLIKLWSADTIDFELARLVSLTPTITTLLEMVEWQMEDFRNAFTAILSSLSALISSHGTPEQATRLVTERFNDPETDMNVVYFLKLITVAELLSNPMAYEPFLDQGMSIGNEKMTLLAANTEIDYLGLTVLIAALMKPARIAVEIVVLERSAGNEVNTHRYDMDLDGNSMGPSAPTAYILYKPGHYDILYKGNTNAINQQQVMTAAAAAQNVQVNRAAMPTRQLDPSPMPMSYGNGLDMGLLSAIPGISMNPFTGFGHSYSTSMSSSFAPSPSAYTPSSSTFATSPYGIDPSMSMSGMPSSMQSAPIAIKSISPSPMSVASTLASIPLIPTSSRQARTPPHSSFSSGSHFSSTALPSHPASRNNSIATDASLLSPVGLTPTTAQLSALPLTSTDQFRQSIYMLKRPADSGLRGGAGGGGASGSASAGWGTQYVPRGEGEMQTRQFRESHHNEAHFDNKNFQPYLWSPEMEGDDEGGVVSAGGAGGQGGGGSGVGGPRKARGRGRRAS